MAKYVHIEIGTKINRLTVISSPFKKGKKELWLVCRCDCGTEKDVRKRDLDKGRVRSCSCLQKETAAQLSINNTKYSGDESAFNNLYKSYQGSAKERKLAFELSKEEFRSITQNNCYYCGEPPGNVRLSKSTKAGSYVFNGVDRVDNNEGYLSSNVVTCCEDCNYMKRMTETQCFINKCKRIAEKHSL